MLSGDQCLAWCRTSGGFWVPIAINPAQKCERPAPDSELAVVRSFKSQASRQGRNQRFTLSMQHVFSPTLLNTINAGFSRAVGTGNVDAEAKLPMATDKSLGFFPGQNAGSLTIGDLQLPTNTPGGFGATGGDSVWYTAPQLNDNLTWVKGRKQYPDRLQRRGHSR